jgi:hypothetical protein
MLMNYLDTPPVPDHLRWWILQRAAWYARSMNPVQSLEWQKAACMRDTRALRPPQGTQYRKQAVKQESAAAAILEWCGEYAYDNGAVAAVDELRSQLVFAPDASSDRFEEGMRRLGTMLGLHAERPEKECGKGPDVLWLSGQVSMPIEAKNNVAKTVAVFSKRDIEQLAQSVAWTRDIHDDRTSVIPLMAHPASRAANDAIAPEKMRVFTPETLAALLAKLAAFVAALVALPAGHRDIDHVARLLEDHGLMLQKVLAEYTVKVK